MDRVKFDPTFNLGHLLSATVFLVSAGVAWASVIVRVDVLDRQIIELKQRDTEMARDQREAAIIIETRLIQEITRNKAAQDQVIFRTSEDIREIKQTIFNGFRDLDSKLQNKQDRPGR